MDSLDPPGSTDDSTGVVFRDALFLMMLGMVAVIFLINLLINPESESQHEIPIHGEVVIEAFWPSGTKYDVDLWVMGPDNVPVGWGQHETTPTLNLERDDRGEINDASDLNYEIISVRTRLPGEYIVNVHLYQPHAEPLPVPVTVKVVGKEDLGEIYSGVTVLNERPRVVCVHYSNALRSKVGPTPPRIGRAGTILIWLSFRLSGTSWPSSPRAKRTTVTSRGLSFNTVTPE